MKPNGPVFDKAWSGRVSVVPCSVAHVNEFMRRHYLRTRPGVVTLCLMMLEDCFAIGAVVFALPPRESHVRFRGLTWELARLFIEDRIPANAETWLIAQAVKYIKANHPDVAVLVSYADPSAGHAGTIYKAANWIADGRTDQERKSPRFDLIDARTGKKFSRRSHVPESTVTVRKPRISKWRFYYRIHDEAQVAAS